MMPRRAALALFRASAALTGLMAVLFWFAPGIDLAVSRLFGGPAGFPMADSAFWQALRQALRYMTDLTAIAALIFAVLAHTWRNLTPLRIRVMDFWVFAYILVPGVIVNGIFKATSGRARPRAITEFGGDKDFTQAFLWADQCARNCSFVSGEASALAAFGTMATLLFWRHLTRLHMCLLWGICLFGALLRVPFGGHFLSDVLIAMTMTSGLITLGFLWLKLDRLPGPLLRRT